MRRYAIWVTVMAVLATATASAQIMIFRGPLMVTTRPAQKKVTRPAPAPTTQPSEADLSTQDQELVRMLRQEVEQQVKQMHSDRPREREMAQQSLQQIHQQFLMPLEVARKSNLSVGEYNEALADWIMEIRLAQMGSEMGMNQMAKVRKMRQVKPDILNLLISDDPRRQVAGLNMLHSWDDPEQLAEPLVIRAMRNNGFEAFQYVISLVSRDRYTSTAMLDVLLDLYDGKITRPISPTSPYAYLSDPANIRSQLIPVLSRFEDKRLPQILLGALMDRNNRQCYQASPIIAGLVKNKAIGGIPWLMENMTIDPVYSTTAWNNQKVTMAMVDSIIVAAIRISGQKDDDYKVKSISYGGPMSQFGFETEEARKDAVEKLRKWWEANKDKAPYRNASKIVPQSPNNSDMRSR